MLVFPFCVNNFQIQFLILVKVICLFYGRSIGTAAFDLVTNHNMSCHMLFRYSSNMIGIIKVFPMICALNGHILNVDVPNNFILPFRKKQHILGVRLMEELKTMKMMLGLLLFQDRLQLLDGKGFMDYLVRLHQINGCLRQVYLNLAMRKNLFHYLH